MTTPSLTNPNPKREGETLTAEQRDEAARLVFFNAWPGLDMKDWNKAGNGRGEAEWQRERAFSIVDMISARLACLGLDALASARPSSGDPVRAALEGNAFTGWSTSDLAGQCRMQARENLDPELTAFMFAVADRLAALSVSTPTGEGEEAVEAASAAFYDSMIGPEEKFWPHHEGWKGKDEAFKARVRGRMKLALEAAALAHPQQGGERDGWKLMPRKPTPDMLTAGIDNNPTAWTDGTDQGFAQDVANDVYISMWDAAPTPPSKSSGEEATPSATQDAEVRS